MNRPPTTTARRGTPSQDARGGWPAASVRVLDAIDDAFECMNDPVIFIKVSRAGGNCRDLQNAIMFWLSHDSKATNIGEGHPRNRGRRK